MEWGWIFCLSLCIILCCSLTWCRGRFPLQCTTLCLCHEWQSSWGMIWGERAWPDFSPSHVVSSKFVVKKLGDHDHMPDWLPPCAVTQAHISYAKRKQQFIWGMLLLPAFPSSLTVIWRRSSKKIPPCRSSQVRSIPSIRWQVKRAVIPHDYFLEEGFTVSKWLPHWESFVGEAIFQIMSPVKQGG